MKMILTIDLGNESARVGLINQYGDIQAKFIIENNKNNLVENLYKKIIEGLENIGIDYSEQIEKIGFASVGFVDHMSGIVNYSANLGFNNFNLKAEATRLFQKPVFLLNDANAAALGEFWTGSATQFDSIIFYTLDAGVGGAIIIEGRLMSGSRGYAGEFGHGGFFQNTTKCSCGLQGCIEPVTSVQGIEIFFNNFIKENPKHPITVYFDGIENISLKNIKEQYENHKKPSEIKEVLSLSLDPLAKHMATMIMAVDPEAIIISGSVANFGTLLIDILKSLINNYTLERFTQELSIVIAELNTDAAMVGAGYYALNDWKIY